MASASVDITSHHLQVWLLMIASGEVSATAVWFLFTDSDMPTSQEPCSHMHMHASSWCLQIEPTDRLRHQQLSTSPPATKVLVVMLARRLSATTVCFSSLTLLCALDTQTALAARLHANIWFLRTRGPTMIQTSDTQRLHVTWAVWCRCTSAAVPCSPTCSGDRLYVIFTVGCSSRL